MIGPLKRQFDPGYLPMRYLLTVILVRAVPLTAQQYHARGKKLIEIGFRMVARMRLTSAKNTPALCDLSFNSGKGKQVGIAKISEKCERSRKKFLTRYKIKIPIS